MILKAYALYDEKAGAFALPFFTQNHALAIRMVQEVGSDGSTMVGRHPNDFMLYHVGEWDDNVGQFIAFPVVGLGVVSSFLSRATAMPLFEREPVLNGVREGGVV